MIRVNGDIVPEQAVEYELQRLLKFYSEHFSPEQIEESKELLKEKAKEQAIGLKLLLQEAARLDIKMDEAKVDEKIEQMATNVGGHDKFEKMLKTQGLTQEGVRGSIRNGGQVDVLTEKIVSEIPEPAEQQIKTFYEAHKEEYAKPDASQIRHILLKPASANEQDIAVSRSKLEGIREAIVTDNKDFAAAAAVHSDCPSGKKSGGSLGWIAKGSMVPEIEEIVSALEMGDVSEVIETKLGLHLMEKTDHEDSIPAEYDEVRDKVKELLMHSNRGEAIASCVAELKAKAVIEES